jgi:hypothetical protein
MTFRLPAAVLLLVWLTGCSDLGDRTPAPTGPDPAPTWSADVQPLLQASCVGCHSGALMLGNLDLSSYASLMDDRDGNPAVLAGQADSSLLIQRLETGNTTLRMPQGGSPWPASQIATLRQWIDEGALND